MRDQYTYTAEVLNRHAECIFEEWYCLRQHGLAEVKSRADPGLQSDLPLIVADIRRAWSRAGLDATERQIFTLSHFWTFSLSDISLIYGLDVAEVAAVLDDTTRRLLDEMNGVRGG